MSHMERMSWTGIVEEDRQMEEPEESEEVQRRCEEVEEEAVEKKKETYLRKKKKETIEDTLSQIDYFQEIAESLRAFACMMVDIKVVKVEMKGIKEMLQELTEKKRKERENAREDESNDGHQKARERNEKDAMIGKRTMVDDSRDEHRKERDEGEIDKIERKRNQTGVGTRRGSMVDDTGDEHRKEPDEGKIEIIEKERNELDIRTGKQVMVEDTTNEHTFEQDEGEIEKMERERSEMDTGTGGGMVVENTRVKHREERYEDEIETNLDVGEHAENVPDHGELEESDDEAVGFHDVFGESSSDDEDAGLDGEGTDAEKIDEDSRILGNVRGDEEKKLEKGKGRENIGIILDLKDVESHVEDSGRLVEAREEEKGKAGRKSDRDNESTQREGTVTDETSPRDGKIWEKLSDKMICDLYERAKSKGAFARNVLRNLVNDDILIKSNCYGKAHGNSRRPDVQAIDPDVLEYVLKTTYDVYGVDEADREKCRKECVTIINSCCRKLVCKLFQKERIKKARQNMEGRRKSILIQNTEYTLDRGKLRKTQSSLDNERGVNPDKIPPKLLSDKEINDIQRSHPLTRGSFAIQILKKIVSDDVLINSNCSGRRHSNSSRPDVQAIDPEILDYVLKTTYDVYSVGESDREKCRKECVTRINAHCRRLVYKLFQKPDWEEESERELTEGKEIADEQLNPKEMSGSF